MAKQVHFVVVVDLDEKDFYIDDETFRAKFHEDEGTWNTATNKWEATEWEDNLAALEVLHSRLLK